jgi:hypothetical protein
VHFLRIVTSGGFCVSFVFSRLKKRIAKITGTFHFNTPLFLFLFIALAFMDGHYLQTMSNQGYNPLIAIQMALSGQIYAERGE